MSFFSEAKEIINEVKKIRKGNIVAKNIVDLLKIISFLMVWATFIMQYWKISFDINVGALPIFLKKFLDEYIYMFFWLLIIYINVGHELLSYLVIIIQIKFNKKLFPVLNTAEDVFEIGMLFLLLLKLSNNLFLCNRGVDVIKIEIKNIYLVYVIYCFCLFVNWLYIKNKIYWYLINIKYTPYFDYNGDRIAQNDKVIFYGRLYSVHLLDKEWYLLKSDSRVIRQEILLADAVCDEKGKIRVYEYGMGEKV